MQHIFWWPNMLSKKNFNMTPISVNHQSNILNVKFNLKLTLYTNGEGINIITVAPVIID